MSVVNFSVDTLFKPFHDSRSSISNELVAQFKVAQRDVVVKFMKSRWERDLEVACRYGQPYIEVPVARMYSKKVFGALRHLMTNDYIDLVEGVYYRVVPISERVGCLYVQETVKVTIFKSLYDAISEVLQRSYPNIVCKRVGEYLRIGIIFDNY